MDKRNYGRLSPILYLGFLFLVGTACHNNASNNNPAQANQESSTSQSLSDDPSLSTWAELIRGTELNIGNAYTENAVFLGPTGTLGFPLEEQIRYHQIRYKNLTSLSSLHRVMANEERGYFYEIGHFTNAKQEEFKHLLILKQQGDTLRREMEFIAPASAVDSSALLAFDQRRTEWMELCNAHNAEKLVTSLYTPDALYYNHKPLIVGHEAIIKDYQYMNRESYSLQLKPIHIELVNDRMAYEIGQCSGSYGGKYLFVWYKDGQGKWSVLMDSNI